MSRILLQTTIERCDDDWDVARFSLLADELRAAGHEVTARNRADRNYDDPILSQLDSLEFDQLWLMAVDIGDGLSAADAAGITRFRGNGGGVLVARDHQDLGRSVLKLGSLGLVNHFHSENADPTDRRDDDRDTPEISWPNYHSGANGDYQPVVQVGRAHDLLRSTRSASGHIEWFPAHPHEGCVSANVPGATVLAQGRSSATGRYFNLAVLLDGERTVDGQPLARAIAESTFHHFADYNWDLDRGAPSFVTEPPGSQIKADPSHLAVFKDYVRNIAHWLVHRAAA